MAISKEIKAFIDNAAVEVSGRVLSHGIDTQLWVDAKAFVADAANMEGLSGVEKKEHVKKQLKFIFKDVLHEISWIAEDILEILIRMAYTHLVNSAKGSNDAN